MPSYECKADCADKLAWQFREPIAALMIDGKTVDKHFAGPSCELAGGRRGNRQGWRGARREQAKDIPLLKLAVISHRGADQLTGASIQRINTRGGTAEGACAESGTFMSVPYSADYVLLRKGG